MKPPSIYNTYAQEKRAKKSQTMSKIIQRNRQISRKMLSIGSEIGLKIFPQFEKPIRVATFIADKILQNNRTGTFGADQMIMVPSFFKRIYG